MDRLLVGLLDLRKALLLLVGLPDLDLLVGLRDGDFLTGLRDPAD